MLTKFFQFVALSSKISRNCRMAPIEKSAIVDVGVISIISEVQLSLP
ncbi:hypothetical protein CEV33_0024 [Brucella grignonensis]|uniref:Uncharacterized protein n=1 Tax=Brucella grignonensis TaxID=94627 RepID=A0A256FM94_9HYPH|nr:hypothetical protein CEV33_0024 [Brucella grignonensis]